MKERIALLQSLFPPDTQDALYLVGGCVRDHLLGVVPRDLDLVTTLDDNTLRQAGFRPVIGKTTIPIWFRHHPGFGNIEISIIVPGMTLADDLQRRDFTINALAMSLAGELFDPHSGQADLQKRLLRACTADIFRDDPLRLFRALRFEAEGWQIVPATEALIGQRDWTTELSAIPVERFSREMIRALSAHHPERFFQRMVELGIGRHWLRELFQMSQVPAGPLCYHPEGDLFSHSIQVMQRVAMADNSALARFCGLFHDIGKLVTEPSMYPKHHGHAEAGFSPALQLCQHLKLPAEWGRALSWTTRLHTKANNWHELRTSTRLGLATQAIKAGIVHILPLVSAADTSDAHVMQGWDRVVQVCRMSSEELGVDKHQLEALLPEKRGSYLLQRQIEKVSFSDNP